MAQNDHHAVISIHKSRAATTLLVVCWVAAKDELKEISFSLIKTKFKVKNS
jgi:hypothetical protein